MVAHHVRSGSAQRLEVPRQTGGKGEVRRRPVERADQPTHVREGGIRDYLRVGAFRHHSFDEGQYLAPRLVYPEEAGCRGIADSLKVHEKRVNRRGPLAGTTPDGVANSRHARDEAAGEPDLFFVVIQLYHRPRVHGACRMRASPLRR